METQVVAEVAEGDFIGDYQVLEVLGRGLVGTCYHVISNAQGKEFALRTLRITEQHDPEWLSRLEAQATVLQRLAHPNIDGIVSSGCFRDIWMCVKDYVHDGEGRACHLGEYMSLHGGRLSPYQVYHVVAQLVAALRYAHGYVDGHHRGLFHGNLKPQNVLIAYSTGERGASQAPFEVKVGDFQPYRLMTRDVVVDSYLEWKRALGSYPSLIRDEAVSAVLSMIFRCYHYRAPEFWGLSKLTPQSDIYSVGVLLYEMLTGNLPCGNFPLPSAVRPELPMYWDEVVNKCLQWRPELRYQTVEELYSDIATNLGEEVDVPAEETAAVVEEAVPKGRRERFSLTPKGMVYVPCGTYLVGSEECGSDALPQHECETEGFYIDRTPVTNMQFGAFVLETGYVTETEEAGEGFIWVDGTWRSFEGINWRNPMGKEIPDDFDLHPVTQVSYRDAAAYAQWLGRRLPTEQEWEYAARGGQKETRFPWGNTASRTHANYGSDHTCGVMQYHANGYGLYDMGGNVWEWTDSWYQPYPGNPGTSPHFGEKYRVVRGGCWMHDGSHCMVSYRNANQSDRCYPTVGFRTIMMFSDEG